MDYRDAGTRHFSGEYTLTLYGFIPMSDSEDMNVNVLPSRFVYLMQLCDRGLVKGKMSKANLYSM